jgi:UDP-2-acetamido-2,6-beta-L-arabino-hexul-4-ose reductase
MKILVTGADGFIGRNLLQHLSVRPDIGVQPFTRADRPADLPAMVRAADFIVHLAGVNRPNDPSEFVSGNVGLTGTLADAVAEEAAQSGRRPPVVYASSVQATLDNPYGRSKLAAERCLVAVGERSGSAIRILRLPNVFGKWARPNYNSAVATFCHNVTRGLPIEVRDAAAPLTLVYVDDVVRAIVAMVDGDLGTDSHPVIEPQYATTVGEVATLIRRFAESRTTLLTERVGAGLVRALYATYVSYLPPDAFAYSIPRHADSRGEFVEMLKTPDAGQFSFFTAHPGVTRGGHYHHSKTEKFLVVRGEARFRFRNVRTGDYHELLTSGATPVVVETVPGWTHDITNVGSGELVVMLWANEIFDRDRPDTIACPV